MGIAYYERFTKLYIFREINYCYYEETCKGRGVEDHDTKGNVLFPQEQDAGGMNGILLQGFSFFAYFTTCFMR